MLKSSPALDGFHSVLKMKRKVAGGGGGEAVRGEWGEWGEWGSEDLKQKDLKKT